MRLLPHFSIKAKQVAGVSGLVALSVLIVSTWTVATLVRVRLAELNASAKFIAKAAYQRAFPVVQAGGDPLDNLRTDPGLRSIFEAAEYSEGVFSVDMVDENNQFIVGTPTQLDERITVQDLTALLEAGPIAKIKAIYWQGPQVYEFRMPLFNEGRMIMSVRVRVSTFYLNKQLTRELREPMITAAAAIAISTIAALLMAQIGLRPIHVIRSGLARLGRGELDVNVDLPRDADLGDLGDSFKAVSARLAADQSALAGQRATLESVVDHLEDAVALFDPDGALLFANAAMRPALTGDQGRVGELLPAGHPYRVAVEDVLATRTGRPPESVTLPSGGEFLLLTHPVTDAQDRPLGVMLVARNLTYLTQVESTLSYSRKLAALGRLSAGIAHEVKNPLNATTIHLELLKMQLADAPDALEHVKVIAAQVRRLDEVVQGLLKFTRPEDLRLQPVSLAPLFDDLMPILAAEAGKSHVDIRLEVPRDLPMASADPSLLQQAFLNLALNACQAMPNGGRLRIAATAKGHRHVAIVFEDTGTGIPPEQLSRIFDLYFTTKESGSGIGLSLVYRTIQLHDGEIEVQSVPGRGTTFSILLPMARSRSSVPAAAAS